MRVLLIHNQPHIRTAIQFLLDQQPDIWVVGTADTSDVLPEQTNTLRPDIVAFAGAALRTTPYSCKQLLHSLNPLPPSSSWGTTAHPPGC
jgi:chemotaxis response regulator CheB